MSCSADNRKVVAPGRSYGFAPGWEGGGRGNSNCGGDSPYLHLRCRECLEEYWNQIAVEIFHSLCWGEIFVVHFLLTRVVFYWRTII